MFIYRDICLMDTSQFVLPTQLSPLVLILLTDSVKGVSLYPCSLQLSLPASSTQLASQLFKCIPLLKEVSYIAFLCPVPMKSFEGLKHTTQYRV